MSEQTVTPSVGFFGKLPTQGDFVSRDLPPDFTLAWDAWLQRGITLSRDLLGEAWLDLFMTMPPWHFSMAAGVCGDASISGVMIPSVDRVGRYFPFTVAAPRAGLHVPGQGDESWHERLEQLALAVLAPEFVFDDYAAQLQNFDLPDDKLQSRGERVAIRSSSSDGLRESLLAFAAPRVTLLWTDGGEAMEASYLAFLGLPAGSLFTAMLDGDWRRPGTIEEAG